MIVFDLRCKSGHAFEAWFASGVAYERQAKAGVVTCPTCGSSKVHKAPMAPNLLSHRTRSADAPAAAPKDGPTMATKGDFEQAAEVKRALRELRRQVEKNCRYVGHSFAEEARKIHYGEVKAHNIYGQTTSKEAKELNDEGIEFGILPWAGRSDS
jgi:hypothetical protein